MVLLVLHPEPFSLLNERALVTLIQQPGGEAMGVDSIASMSARVPRLASL
jgi:hypothetical protein